MKIINVLQMGFSQDNSGNVTTIYDAWGNMVSKTGSTLQPFKYVGRYGYYAHYQDDNVMPYSVVTGSSSSGIPGNTALSFIQTGVRTYFPRLGRYMQVDPARDGINYLMYSNNNPVNYMDPTGKWFLSAIGKLGNCAWKTFQCGFFSDLFIMAVTTAVGGGIGALVGLLGGPFSEITVPVGFVAGLKIGLQFGSSIAGLYFLVQFIRCVNDISFEENEQEARDIVNQFDEKEN